MGKGMVKGFETGRKPAFGEEKIESVKDLFADLGPRRGPEGFAEGNVEAASRHERWQRLAEEPEGGFQRSPGMRLLGSSKEASGGPEPDLAGEAFFSAKPVEGGEAVTVFCASPDFATAPAPGQFFATYAGAKSEIYTDPNGDFVIDLAFDVYDPSAPGGGAVWRSTRWSTWPHAPAVFSTRDSGL